MEVWGTQGPSTSRLFFLSPRTVGKRCPSRRMTMAASPWMAMCSAGSATLPEPRPEQGMGESLPHQRRPPCPPFSYVFDVQPLLPRQSPPQDPRHPVRGSQHGLGLQSPSSGFPAQPTPPHRDHAPSPGVPHLWGHHVERCCFHCRTDALGWRLSSCVLCLLQPGDARTPGGWTGPGRPAWIFPPTPMLPGCGYSYK